MVGLLIIGGYSICYLLALANSITPGMSPLLWVFSRSSLWIIERHFAASRLLGLFIALIGLNDIGCAEFI